MRKVVTTIPVPDGETTFFADGTFNTLEGSLTVDTRYWLHDDWQAVLNAPASERVSVAREIDRARALIDPANYEGAMTIIGMQCSIQWHDDNDGGLQDVYISFSEDLLNHEGETAEEDIYGVPDEKIFFYLDKEQVDSLTSAILNEDEFWSIEDKEWFIDLSEGCEAITDPNNI